MALVAFAIVAATPSLAETVRTGIGPREPGCRMASGPVEAMTCEGPGGWRVHVGFPAFGATLALAEGRRPGRGGPPFLLDGVGDPGVPAVWQVTVAAGGRATGTVLIPVSVMHPEDREQMIAQGGPPSGTRRVGLLLAYRLRSDGACLAAIVDRSVNRDAEALGLDAAKGEGACPGEPAIPGHVSAVLRMVLGVR